MLSTNYLAILLLLISGTFAHNPALPVAPLRITLVTAWWPAQNSPQAVPTGEYLAAFQKILKLPFNLIVFGDKALSEIVSKNRDSTKTLFYEHPASALRESWYNKLVKQLKDKGQNINAVDLATPILTYGRMILLGKAAQNDHFDTDEFIWVDPNAFNSPKIANILEQKHLSTLMEAFNHFFFMLPVQKDESKHALPNVEKTPYFQKYEVFVSTQVFGGKIQTIKTMKTLYEDHLKVVLQFDHNLWSQDAILGLLADRFPFTVSYMTVDFDQSESGGNRLLAEDSQIRLYEEEKDMEFYEQVYGWCEVGIIIMGILIAFEVFRYLKYTKKYYQNESSTQFELEGSSLNRINDQ